MIDLPESLQQIYEEEIDKIDQDDALELLQ